MKTIIQFLKGKPTLLMLIAVFCATTLTSCSNDESDSDMLQGTSVKYSGSFVKAKDDVVTSATGTSNVTFDTNTLKLSYTISWSGLGSNAINMHFHDNGPVIVEIVGFANTTNGTVSGTAELTSAQASDLAAGKIYVQIHTANYPGGEVIAALTKISGSSSGSGNGGGGGY